jgi:hypothetical protein
MQPSDDVNAIAKPQQQQQQLQQQQPFKGLLDHMHSKFSNDKGLHPHSARAAINSPSEAANQQQQQQQQQQQELSKSPSAVALPRRAPSLMLDAARASSYDSQSSPNSRQASYSARASEAPTSTVAAGGGGLAAGSPGGDTVVGQRGGSRWAVATPVETTDTEGKVTSTPSPFGEDHGISSRSHIIGAPSPRNDRGCRGAAGWSGGSSATSTTSTALSAWQQQSSTSSGTGSSTSNGGGGNSGGASINASFVSSDGAAHSYGAEIVPNSLMQATSYLQLDRVPSKDTGMQGVAAATGMAQPPTPNIRQQLNSRAGRKPDLNT